MNSLNFIIQFYFFGFMNHLKNCIFFKSSGLFPNLIALKHAYLPNCNSSCVIYETTLIKCHRK